MADMIPSVNIFPSYVNGKFVDDVGEVTPDWNVYLDQTTTALQYFFNQEGFLIPGQDATMVTLLETTKSAGRLLVNSDTGDLLFNKNGTWVNLTP